MKQQPDRFLGNTLHVGIPHRLPRSDADDRLVVKIITRLAVVDSASRRLLEEYRIEPHRHPVVSLALGRIERNDADLRVAGLEPEEFVIVFLQIRPTCRAAETVIGVILSVIGVYYCTSAYFTVDQTSNQGKYIRNTYTKRMPRGM